MDPQPNSQTEVTASVVGRPKHLGSIYTLPAPIRTFPLPTFYPNNPISLFHLVYAWLKQALSPPPAEPSVIHIGIWDPDTRSVHIKDLASIRALWEQGFYGKGSLSRSEPNWLKRELARRGSASGKSVSEIRTEARREERRLLKWERAKAELEALEQQRLAEAAGSSTPVIPAVHVGLRKLKPEISRVVEAAKAPAAEGDEPAPRGTVVDSVPEPVVREVASQPSLLSKSSRVEEPKSPVSPVELLEPSNSYSLPIRPSVESAHVQQKSPVGPAELLALPNSIAELVTKPGVAKTVCESWDTLVPSPFSPVQLPTPPENDIVERSVEVNDINGHADKASAFASDVEQAPKETKPIFSADVVTAHVPLTPSKRTAGGVSREEQDYQPPKRRKSVRFSPEVESDKDEAPTTLAAPQAPSSRSGSEIAPAHPTEIEDKEHFQLSPEEAFFLQFSLGALRVVDPKTGEPISTERLLSLFRSHSYFPPSADPRPDDPFLIHYTVYHHFRSLGWVPRHGIKFGVDWILYQRGPVFDHSEFGIMVMPAYSNELWKEHEHPTSKKSWSWLMGVNRVLSHVLKSLVLVYVDIPPPPVFDEAMRQGGIAAALKKYNVREVMVRRFSVNRNR